MANPGFIATLLGPLPAAVKVPLQSVFDYAFRQLRFGVPGELPAPSENFGGHLVPFTTSGTTNAEVAVAHGLGRVPRLAFPVLALDTVNATAPTLTVTRAADATYLYLSAAETGVSLWLYVE